MQKSKKTENSKIRKSRKKIKSPKIQKIQKSKNPENSKTRKSRKIKKPIIQKNQNYKNPTNLKRRKRGTAESRKSINQEINKTCANKFSEKSKIPCLRKSENVAEPASSKNPAPQISMLICRCLMRGQQKPSNIEIWGVGGGVIFSNAKIDSSLYFCT